MLDRLVSLAGGEVQIGVAQEFIPLQKISSIPNGTCAFRRLRFSHGIALMTWKINTPDNLALARTIGREFASIIAAGQQKYLDQNEQGYGNYGTSNLVPAQPEQLIM